MRLNEIYHKIRELRKNMTKQKQWILDLEVAAETFCPDYESPLLNKILYKNDFD